MKPGLRRVAVAVAIVLFLAGAVPSGAHAAANPFRFLSLRALPPSLPTSPGGATTYPALIVSITDAQGDPTVSPNNTIIYLSSSNPSVLTAASSVVISAGEQYAVANVATTKTPGNSTITAVTPGYEAATVNFATYEPRGFPTQLQIYPMPDAFPTGKAYGSTFTVVVEDAAGLPARTIQDSAIQVTSSNTGVVSVGSATIAANQTVGYGTLRTTGAPGVVSITASAQGLVSATAFVTVVGSAQAPLHLLLSAPPTLPADGGSYNSVTVSLLDNASRPAPAKSPVAVLLTSSRPDIASIQQTVSIPANSSFATVTLDTGSASGSAFITASAVNFTSDTIVLNTVDIPPTKLGMYLSDSVGLVSPAAGSLDFVIQLQDAKGVPAEARSPANIIVSFSNTSLLSSPIALTIPRGTDLAYGSVPLPRGTEGTFTAISNGLYSTSVAFEAQRLSVAASMGPSSSTIHSNQTATVYFSLRFQGRPVAGAALTWTATDGTIVSGSAVTDSSGSASAVFAPAGLGPALVSVTASSPAIGSVNSSTPIVVLAYPPKATPSLLTQILSPLYLGAIIAAVAVVIVALVLVRRRRKETVEDEDTFNMGPAPGEGTAFDLRA